jgi:hypothetical protein
LRCAWLSREHDQHTACGNSALSRCAFTTAAKKVGQNLANWQFSHNDKPLKREHRNYWLDKWHAMNMPQARISTFRWTLIPETLDYLPDEEGGGNII